MLLFPKAMVRKLVRKVFRLAPIIKAFPSDEADSG